VGQHGGWAAAYLKDIAARIGSLDATGIAYGDPTAVAAFYGLTRALHACQASLAASVSAPPTTRLTTAYNYFVQACAHFNSGGTLLEQALQTLSAPLLEQGFAEVKAGGDSLVVGASEIQRQLGG
jgi:hypothetical protein